LKESKEQDMYFTLVIYNIQIWLKKDSVNVPSIPQFILWL